MSLAPPRFRDILARTRPKARLRAHPQRIEKAGRTRMSLRCHAREGNTRRLQLREQILDIADNTADDWSYNPESGKLSIQKEAILRSKLRIEARQFHMSRLHVQQWGEKQAIDIKSNWALLSEDERRRKADELIQIIRELREPPTQPPPLVYRPEETPDEREPSGIGSQRRP
jgi:hypothetical protein